MVDKESFIEAFGTLTEAGKKMNCSRQSIYDWIELGYIPKICDGGPTSSRGKNWHKILKKQGLTKNLTKIKKKKK